MKPKLLKAGNRIGIVSPSSPITAEHCKRYEQGVKSLAEFGFEIVLGKYASSLSWDYAASQKEKAQDLNSFFSDPSIDAIVFSQGGDTGNAALSYLDWDVIKNKPKILLGISDATVVLNAVHAKTGLITFHGNDLLYGFGSNPTGYDLSEFKRVLIEGQTGSVPALSARKSVRSGIAEGRLIGGNLRCFLKLAGTPYFPDLDGAILFLEAFQIDPEGCETMLTQLKHIGVFEQIKGTVIGYVDGLRRPRYSLLQMEDILLRVSDDYEFPILRLDEFGHNCPNTVLPIGARVRLDADAGDLSVLDAVLADVGS